MTSRSLVSAEIKRAVVKARRILRDVDAKTVGQYGSNRYRINRNEVPVHLSLGKAAENRLRLDSARDEDSASTPSK